MKVKFSHVGFNVSDMKKSLHFYTEILGLKRAFTYTKNNGKPWIEFIRIDKSHYIELFYEKPDREYSYENGSFKHVSLECENCLEYYNRIKNSGYEIYRDLIKGPDNNYQFWVKDPDGHPFEIIEVDKNSPHYFNEINDEYASYDFDLRQYDK